MDKRRKHGARTSTERVGSTRKLSEIIKEMALRVLKKPDATPTATAAQIALLHATAAWNSPLQEADLPGQLQKAIGKILRGQASPWEELLSTDTDWLIRELVAYKHAHYPNDRRRVLAAEMNPEGNLRVHWVEGEKPDVALVGSREHEAAGAGSDAGGPSPRS